MAFAAVVSCAMRLYRGLKNPYRPELVDQSQRVGTDFTDCPATALLYAQGSRGALVVVDIAVTDGEDLAPDRVTKALWLDRQAQRFIMWGRFDDVIVAVFQAKDLRTRLRREGLRNAAHARKTSVLRAVIDDDLQRRALHELGLRSEFDDRTTFHE
jgi:hypothetical protein